MRLFRAGEVLPNVSLHRNPESLDEVAGKNSSRRVLSVAVAFGLGLVSVVTARAANDIELVLGNTRTNVSATNPFAPTDDSAQLGVDLINSGWDTANQVTISTSESGTNGQAGNLTLNADLDFNNPASNSKVLSLNAHNNIVINNAIHDSAAGSDFLGLYMTPDTDVLNGGAVHLNSTLGGSLFTTIYGDLIIGSAGGYSIDQSGAGLRVDSIDNSAGGGFSFTAGQLLLQNDGLSVDAAGLLGAAVTIDAGKSLTTQFQTVGAAAASSGTLTQDGGNNFVSGALTINAGGIYNLSGGSLNTSSVDNSGVFSQSGGTHSVENILTINSGGSYSLAGGELRVDSIANSGVFDYTGGTLRLSSALDVGSGGLLGDNVDLGVSKHLILQLGSTGVSVSTGGVLNLNGGTLVTPDINMTGGSFAFTSGSLNLWNSGLDIGVGQVLGNNVSLDSGKSLEISGIATVNSGATLTLNGGSLTAQNISTSGGSFSFTSGDLTLTNSGLTVGSGGLLGGGLVSLSANRRLTVGDISVNSGSTLAVNGGTQYGNSIQNSGAVRVNDGSLNVYTVGNNGDLRVSGFLSAAGSVSNSGILRVETAGSASVNGNITNTGTLVVAGFLANNAGPDPAVSDTVLNSGNLRVENGGTLVTENLVIQTAGTMVIDGDLLSFGPVLVTGGSIQGGGNIDAGMIITDDGSLRPGNSTGDLFIGGLLMAGGSLGIFELGSDGSGGYLNDRLISSSAPSFSSTSFTDLSLIERPEIRFSLLDALGINDLVDNFAIGDFFRVGGRVTNSSVLNSGAVAALFGEVDFLAQAGADWFSLSLTETGNFLATPTASPVPVPAAVWLFGSGLLGLVGISRRKKSAMPLYRYTWIGDTTSTGFLTNETVHTFCHSVHCDYSLSPGYRYTVSHETEKYLYRSSYRAFAIPVFGRDNASQENRCHFRC